MTIATRRTLAALGLLAAVLAVVAGLVNATPGDHDADARVRHAAALATAGAAASLSPAALTARPDTSITVGAHPSGRPVAPGFVGVSIEFSALSAYTGRNPKAVNPVFEQLLRNLTPGQAPVIRIGGDSSDSTWWPVPGVHTPGGINYTLTRLWLALARSLAVDTRSKMILGVDLAVLGPRLAGIEARALLHGVGAKQVQALEIGNEPKRYVLFPWYRNAAGRLVYIRRRDYGFAQFSSDFARTARVMPSGVALAGPTFGGYTWMPDLPAFMTQEPRVSIITDHTYPLNRCWTRPGQPEYPTTSRLLSTFSSRHLVAGLPPYVALAHRAGDIFRVDEMQSIACGGKTGISDTFTAALWSLDTLFSMVRAGVDGVNLHTFPAAAYGLFHFTHAGGVWRGTVAPEYYGLALFARAAPTGSRLLAIHHRGSTAIRAWATRGRDGTVRVLLLNDSLTQSHTVVVHEPAGAGQATLTRLIAPGVSATSGVTLGGASFSPTTGRLGTVHALRLSASGGGQLRITLPAASAALVTLAPGA